MSNIGLSYNDILLIPNYSEVISRKDVDIASQVQKILP